MYRYLGTDTEVIIPEEIDGTTITSIAADFQSYRYTEDGYTVYTRSKNITKLSIPSTVVEIGIGTWVFLNHLSPSFQEVVVDEDNPVYSSQDGVLYNKDKTKLIAYPASKKDEIFVVPDSVTIICYYAFRECKYLKNVISNDSLVNINYGAFKYSSIETITVPKSVSFIGSFAFCDCDNLKNFNISSENEKYEFYNGAIYLKGRGTMVQLLSYYATSTYTVPANVKKLGTGALSGCDKIQYLTIPNTVTIISNGVCQDCDGLISVNFPSNITKIPKGMFQNCRFKYGLSIFQGLFIIF